MLAQQSLLTLLMVWLLTSVAGLNAAGAPPPGQPNIIVILVDDMGFSDLSCYGSEIPTPHLDALAKGGLRFTQFYNCSRCCPSRASILTGLYSHEAGMGLMNNNLGQDGYLGDLNERCVTMAQVLRPAGYATYAIGKWHVTTQVNAATFAQKYNWPLQRGFDHYYGIISGMANYFHPDTLTRDNERLALPKTGYYTTDAFVNNAIGFIDGTPKGKPFFLYLAFNAPHYPLMAPAEDIAKFRHGIYINGWDSLRTARYQRQLAMGLIDPAWALSPRPPAVRAWDTVSAPERDRFDKLMACYAACVWHMDKAVGVLVDSLRQRDALDNTLIMFLSDNGGNAEGGPDGELAGDPEGLNRMVRCGQSWATLENTPFRRYKHFEHEGGIATSFIVHWPAGFTATNEFRTEPSHIVDIMPTVVAVSGAVYPQTFNGHAILPMEGRSLVPAFANGSMQPRDAIYWEHEGNAAIREGDWKLVRVKGQPWELYDLKADRTELHNLAEAQPEKAAELLAKWQAWAKRTHVFPKPVNANAHKAAAGPAGQS